VADRFVGFAFAAADMLVETDLNGRISFATGAFRSRLGVSADSMHGRPIASLFVPGDAQSLDLAMATGRLRGRIAPVVLRLADPSASPTAVAALLMPPSGVAPARLCFSIGPVASPQAESAAGDIRDRGSFTNLVEDAIRAGQSAGLGLLEVGGIRHGGSPNAARQRQTVHDTLQRVLDETAPGAAAGELADGRYGVLSHAGMDIEQVVARLEHLLRADPLATGTSADTRITATTMDIAAAGLPPAQAARALRYALGQFAQGHRPVVSSCGAQSSSQGTPGGGHQRLADIVATAQARAQQLRQTLADRRFRLLYQPVVGLGDREIHHFEALIRPIPVQGEPPQSIEEFVTFAEMVGLSEELDWAVLEMALVALRAAPQASVAVNMSGLSMQSAGYRDRLIRHLRSLGAILGPASGAAGGGRLLIELTETAEIEDLTGAASAMADLRALGIPVCLDDFGAGAAAFRYLRAFQVDYVKIDGGFVRAAVTQARERAMVTAMIEIATSVGAAVVAETIETEDQSRLMAELGAQYGQGWLFGRPGSLPGSRER